MSKSLVEYGIDGRVAIVTGAGSGIGLDTAVMLAKMGAKVALVGRRAEALAAVEKTIREFSDDVVSFSCNVGSEERVNDLVKAVIDTFGRVDILINNAGGEVNMQKGQMGGDLLMSTSVEEYRTVLDTNLIGHYNFMRACIPHMREQKYGRIVNVSSVTAFSGSVGTAAYVASKAGSIVQTKSFARSVGADNILVNAVAPGMVDTPMHVNTPKENFDFVAARSPLQRVAQPIDIARVIIFLAQENLFMTGETLVPDGGSTMSR